MVLPIKIYNFIFFFFFFRLFRRLHYLIKSFLCYLFEYNCITFLYFHLTFNETDTATENCSFASIQRRRKNICIVSTKYDKRNALESVWLFNGTQYQRLYRLLAIYRYFFRLSSGLAVSWRLLTDADVWLKIAVRRLFYEDHIQRPLANHFFPLIHF